MRQPMPASFTIFQTFTSGVKDVIFQQYDRDFFDLIVIDECHRGGAKDESSWREILEYFEPVVQIEGRQRRNERIMLIPINILESLFIPIV